MYGLATADYLTDDDIQILQNSDDVCTMSVREGEEMCTEIKGFKSWWESKTSRRHRELYDPPDEDDLAVFKTEVIERAAAVLERLDKGFGEAMRSLSGTSATVHTFDSLVQLKNERKSIVIRNLMEMLDSAEGELVSMLMEEGNDDKKDAAVLTTQDYVSNQ